MEGFWGTVCDSGFGREEAVVVCRQLSMKTLGIYHRNLSYFMQVYSINVYSKRLFIAFVGAISVGGAYFGEGSGPILGSIYCTGTESNLTLCSTGSVGQRDCHHGRDVGVICQGMIIVCWAGCCFEEDFTKHLSKGTLHYC